MDIPRTCKLCQVSRVANREHWEGGLPPNSESKVLHASVVDMLPKDLAAFVPCIKRASTQSCDIASSQVPTAISGLSAPNLTASATRVKNKAQAPNPESSALFLRLRPWGKPR